MTELKDAMQQNADAVRAANLVQAQYEAGVAMGEAFVELQKQYGYYTGLEFINAFRKGLYDGLTGRYQEDKPDA